MAIDYDAIIKDGIVEGVAARKESTFSNPTEAQQSLMTALMDCADDLLVGFGKLDQRPGSKFVFNVDFLGRLSKNEFIPTGVIFCTNILVGDRADYSHMAYAGVYVEEQQMSFTHQSLQTKTMTVGTIDRHATPSPLARELATATLLRTVASLAAKQKLVS